MKEEWGKYSEVELEKRERAPIVMYSLITIFTEA